MLLIKEGYLEAFNAFYPIYCGAFPESERKSYEKLSELILGNHYQLIVAYDIQVDGNRPVGFACLLVDEYVWLDYLLVDPSFQGLGYGGQMIQALIDQYKHHKLGIFLEVEKINAHDKNTIRRVDFYQRLGAFATTISYQLPTEVGGFPMDLFYLPLIETMPSTQDCLEAIKMAFNVIHDDLSTRENIYAWILVKNKNRICERKTTLADSMGV